MATPNLKAAVDVIINLALAVKVSQEDGFQLTDIFAFIPALSALPEVIKNKEGIKSEFESLDKAGKDKLVNDAAAKFSTENQRTEAIIESGFDALVTLALFVKIVTAKKDTAE